MLRLVVGKRIVLPLAAALAATVLGGCALDGTVRDPTAAEGPHQRQGRGAKREPVSDEKTAPAAGGGTGGARSANRVTIAAVGDTMLGNTPELPAEPSTYLDPAAELLDGDVVFGNLEGTLTEASESPKCPPQPKGKPQHCFAFRVPPEYAGYLAAAGFTVMSNANNHSYDFGEAGENDTVAALNEAGIAQTGLPGQITIAKAGGRRVAFLGFAPYSYTASLTDLETARALIETAAAEADIVVVAIHAGAEGIGSEHVTGEEETYLGEDRGNAEEFAHLAVDAGADLVLGSGPHVLRGMELYEGRLVAYSLGNFAGYHDFATEGALGESAVLHVELSPDGAFRSGRVDSLRLVEAGQPVPDPTGEAAATIARLSAEDFGESAVKIGAGGTLTAP